MNLILWRHAEAEEGSDDLQRALTAKGHRQAKASAAWLQARLPADYQLWVSDARRSQETAAHLGRPHCQSSLLNPLAAAGRLPDVLRQQHPDNTLVWVGHQPWIGQLCAWLCNGYWQPQHYWSVKKSGFWWFATHIDAHGRPHSKLQAVLTPAMLAHDAGRKSAKKT